MGLYVVQIPLRSEKHKQAYLFRSLHGPVAQLARAPALQAGGRGFESLQVHQKLLTQVRSFYLFIHRRKLGNLAAIFFLVEAVHLEAHILKSLHMHHPY